MTMLRIPTQHARFVLLSSPFLICYLSLTVRNLALIIQSLFTYFLSPSVPLKQLQNLYSIPRRRNKFNIPITRSILTHSSLVPSIWIFPVSLSLVHPSFA